MPFYPQFAKSAGRIPDDVCIPVWIFRNRPEDAAATAFVDSASGQQRTWKQVEDLRRQLARGLAKYFAVKVGDTNTFGLFSPNVRADFACPFESTLLADHDRTSKCHVLSGLLICLEVQ